MADDERVFCEGTFLVRFSGEGIIRADVLAESIGAWGGIYERVPSILAQTNPAFNYLRMVLFIEAIDHGSMIARTVARLVAKSDEDAVKMERDIDRVLSLAQKVFLENIRRMNNPAKCAISAAVGGALTLGAMNMLGYMDDQQQVEINNSSNAVINQGAIYVGTDPAEFMRMVGDATRDNAKLTKQTIAALRPSAFLTDGSVEIGEAGSNLVVSGNAAKIVASMSAEQLQPRIETRRLTNKPIIIRALDLDRKTSGWAAVVPDVSDHRIKVTLSPRVNIPAPGTYFANIDVDVAIDIDGNETPKRGRVLEVQPVQQ